MSEENGVLKEDIYPVEGVALQDDRLEKLEANNKRLAVTIEDQSQEIERLHNQNHELRRQWTEAVDQFTKWVDMSFEEFRQGKMDMPSLQISMKVLPYPPPPEPSPGMVLADRNELNEI